MASPPDTPSPVSETTDNTTLEPSTSGESGKSLLSVVAETFGRAWKLRSSFFLPQLLAGAGLGLAFALGSSYGVGLHNAWKLYGLWWVLFPLLLPLFLLSVLPFVAVIRYVETHSKKGRILVGVAVVLATVAVFVFVGYEGARSDYPLLSSRPANLEALSKSVGEQTRNLGGLSESGTKLLNQLNATETELETAKKQLAITLGTFDAQRQAAQQVTEALRQLDVRQKQIALQTEELERILGGQEPITRNDLQRANRQGLLYGFLLGFVTSFLANFAYGALRKRRVLPE